MAKLWEPVECREAIDYKEKSPLEICSFLFYFENH